MNVSFKRMPPDINFNGGLLYEHDNLKFFQPTNMAHASMDQRPIRDQIDLSSLFYS